MRLLDTQNIEICEFSEWIPQYAILSHTWAKEEVTLQIVLDKARPELQGWTKIWQSCKRAAEDGWQYIWIDTCCIDKTSSVELSEAINSMFRWYSDAAVCYAYLADVTTRSGDPISRREFVASRWFTRGWTLQELLAPSFLMFLDGSWNEIGTRSECADAIALATGIDVAQQANFNSCSIAIKFSWASKRKTKRLEDQAYCLLGLFGISMPLLYGEGAAAFLRLQLELIKITDDETIFAWFRGRINSHKLLYVSEDNYYLPTQHLLATSPSAFAESHGVHRYLVNEERPAFSMTNKGLSIPMQLYKMRDDFEEEEAEGKPPPPYIAFLNCAQTSPSTAKLQPCVMALRLSDAASGRFQTLGTFVARDLDLFDDMEDIGWHLVTITNLNVAPPKERESWHHSDAVEIQCPEGMKIFRTVGSLRKFNESSQSSRDVNHILSWRFCRQITHMVSQTTLLIADLHWHKHPLHPASDNRRMYLVVTSSVRQPIVQLVAATPEHSFDALMDLTDSTASEKLLSGNMTVDTGCGLTITARMKPKPSGNFQGSRFSICVRIKPSRTKSRPTSTRLPRPTPAISPKVCLDRRWLDHNEREAVCLFLRKRLLPKQTEHPHPSKRSKEESRASRSYLDFEEPWFSFDEKGALPSKGRSSAQSLDDVVNLMSNYISTQLGVVSENQEQEMRKHDQDGKEDRERYEKERQEIQEQQEQDKQRQQMEKQHIEKQEKQRQKRQHEEKQKHEEKLRKKQSLKYPREGLALEVKDHSGLRLPSDRFCRRTQIRTV